MLLKFIDLQLFADAEGSSGAAPTAGADSQAAADTGATAPAMQSDAEVGADNVPSTANDARIPWEQARELYKNEIEADAKEYAKRYSKDVVARRSAKNRAALDEFESLKPFLDGELYRRGLEPGQYSALTKVHEDKKALFRERAAQNGTTEEVEEALFNAQEGERNAKTLLAQKEAAEEEDRRLGEIRQQYQIIESDVRSIREQFDPSFDLKREMAENQLFARYANEPHFTLLEAYKLAHHDDIVANARANAATDAVKKTANAVRSGTFPDESAVGSNNAPAHVKVDPSKLSLDEINQMIAEARRGVKHRFS